MQVFNTENEGRKYINPAVNFKNYLIAGNRLGIA
jgi:hypothetical protein